MKRRTADICHRLDDVVVAAVQNRYYQKGGMMNDRKSRLKTCLRCWKWATKNKDRICDNCKGKTHGRQKEKTS